MKTLKLLLLLSTPLLLSSCDLFEKAGDINDYVGNYVVETANEKTYHIYWSQKDLISEKDIDPKCGTRIVITADKKVQYTTPDGTTKTGKVKCLEKYVRFLNTPIESSYKFYKRYNNNLEYSYESKHMSVEYDVTYRSIKLVRE